MAELSASAKDLHRLDAIHGFLSSATAVCHLSAGVLGLPAGFSGLAPGAVAVSQDISEPDCETKLRRAMADSGFAGFDLIIHHAPLDARALNLATRFLAPQATFVAKVVLSQYFGSIKDCLSKLFESVKVHKLVASHSTSAETYILAFKYKHLVEIDLPILDENYFFRESEESSREVAILHETAGKKRFREEAASFPSSPSEELSHGPLSFNPMLKTLECLFSSSSLLQPFFSLPSIRFSRFLETFSLQPSTSFSIASTFGPQYNLNDGASTFLHNRLEVLRWPGTDKMIAFFPTGENSDQVGFLILSVENSSLVVKANDNHEVFATSCKLNHQILRMSVNPVVDSAVSSSPLRVNSSATIGHLLASTMYSVHWYAITVGECGSDSAVPALILLGTKVFKSCGVAHACWNPYIRSQSVILLESGALFLFDFKLFQGANDFDQYCKGTKLKVSWDYPSECGHFKWLACEFSWNYRTLVIARSDAAFVVELEKGQCNVDCLLTIEKLNVRASAQNEQFRTLTKAGSDGFHFALASDNILVLCDVRQLLVPVLQWAHGLEQPCYITVLRLGDLRCNSWDDMYKRASELGYCIILGSFWTAQFKLFCYGPSVAPNGTLASGRAKVSKSLDVWECSSSLLLSGDDCCCGNCLVKKEFEKASLPPWISWQHKKELVLGFSIINKDLYELLYEPDEFGGFTLVRLMSSGNLESQRYCASWNCIEKVEESHEKSSKFEDYLMCYLIDDEYRFPRRFKYLELEYLNGYLNNNLSGVLVSKLKKPSMGPQAKESFTPEFHEILCEKLNVCGLSRGRTSPTVSIVFKDISFPSTMHEVALRRLWADLPIEFLQMAFSCYSEFLAVLVDEKRVSLEFLAVPDQPQLPPFILRNPSWRSTKWSQKVPCTDDALVGPVLPLPSLLALREFHDASPNSESSVKFSVEEELRHRCDEVMQVARELATSDCNAELHDTQVVSLANDKEEAWAASQEAKPFFMHKPFVLRCSVDDDAKSESVYKDEVFGTLISKAREKDRCSDGDMESSGFQIFDSLCPIQLRFDDSNATDFGTKELKAYKLLKKQFSQWQGNFDVYKNFCSNYKL